MFDLASFQDSIRQFGFDGWLLYDFRSSNVPARRILQIADSTHTSRRFLYWIPAQGEPTRIVHRIEDSVLDALPGKKTVYLKWQDFQGAIRDAISGSKRIAMEYSPNNLNPYVSRVDAGTVELVRSFKVEVASSGDLVQKFEAVWTDEQERSHFAAALLTDAAFQIAWSYIAKEIDVNGSVTEKSVQQVILDHFERNGMTTYSPPIVGRGAHAGMPHYETGAGDDTNIRKGDLVLIDLWAKMKAPGSVYSDLTRMGFVGSEIPKTYRDRFEVVTQARDAAISAVEDAFREGRPIQGWEIDDACRGVIEKAGFGPYFVHRTGHNIGQEVHGNGANIDNLETREERRILPGTCFSIEPGLYFDDCGFRSEVDVYVDRQSAVHVTGGTRQTGILPIL